MSYESPSQDAHLDEDDEFAICDASEADKEAIQRALLSAAKKYSSSTVQESLIPPDSAEKDGDGEGLTDEVAAADSAHGGVTATRRQLLSPESVTLNDLFLPPAPQYSSTFTPGSGAANRSKAANRAKDSNSSLDQRQGQGQGQRGYLEDAKKVPSSLYPSPSQLGLI